MKKRGFNYAIEFYNRNILSLDNTNFFKECTIEAEEIESYFEDIVPNITYIRPYILLSYKFNKELRDLDRINYIIGLIYANDYIDFEDFLEVYGDYNIEENKYNLLTELKKSSSWKYTGYSLEANNPDYLVTVKDEELEEIDEESNKEIINKNLFSVPKEEFKKLFDFAVDNGINEDNDTTTMLMDIDEELKIDKENIKKIEEQFDQKIDMELTVKQKIRLYEKYYSKYIENCISYALKQRTINKEDVPAIELAMNDWFEFIFSSLNDLIRLKELTYELNDENIIKFL